MFRDSVLIPSLGVWVSKEDAKTGGCINIQGQGDPCLADRRSCRGQLQNSKKMYVLAYVDWLILANHGNGSFTLLGNVDTSLPLWMVDMLMDPSRIRNFTSPCFFSIHPLCLSVSVSPHATG
jgi:hypothetical protein